MTGQRRGGPAPGASRPRPADPGQGPARGSLAPPSPPPDPVVRRCLVLLTVLATLAAAWAARPLLVPFTFAVVFAAVLSPIAVWLRRLRVPNIVAAVSAVAAPLAAIALVAWFLTPRTEVWRYRLPLFIRTVELKIDGLRDSFAEAREVARQVQQIAGADGGTAIEVTTDAGTDLGFLWNVPVFVASASIVLVLTVFLLVIAPGQIRRLAGGRPFGGRLSRTLAVSGQRLGDDIARYYRTVTLVNLGLAAATAGVLAALGMPQPLLWGAIGGLVNFVPYVGPVVGAGVIAIAALISFDAPLAIALPPLAYVTLTTIEGYMVTPVLVGRTLTLNPLLVLVSVLFWGWLWGIAGAFLAVPLLAFALRLASLPLALHGQPMRRPSPVPTEHEDAEPSPTS